MSWTEHDLVSRAEGFALPFCVKLALNLIFVTSAHRSVPFQFQPIFSQHRSGAVFVTGGAYLPYARCMSTPLGGQGGEGRYDERGVPETPSHTG